MLFKRIGLVDENFNYQENMYVGTEGDRITYVSPKPPTDEGRFGEVYFGNGKILMPGFVNAHCHIPMSLMRGYGENLPLHRWLNEKIFPIEDQLYDEAVYYASLLTMAEALRFGIVSTTDMYFFIDAIISAVDTAGVKCNLSRCIANPMGTPPEALMSIKEMEKSIQLYNGYNNGKIIMETGPHAEYTNNDETVQFIVEMGKQYGVGMHVHISETMDEYNGCIERHGCTPVEYFDKMGLYDLRTNAAHCVWLSENDRSILKNKGVSVSTNPISNLKLVSGICDVNQLLKDGINVAIGTDGVASNNSLNFFESMKMFALLGKFKANDPACMTPQEVLYSATRAGALSQGREDCGLIKESFKADLIVVDANVPNMQPTHSALNNLIYSADGKDVLLTMVDGEVLYKEGEYTTIDVEKAMAATNIAKDNMVAAVNAKNLAR